MAWSREQQWRAVSDERGRLAADLTQLTFEQWRVQSECGQWTVEETLAHLTAAASIGRWRWLRSIVGAKFDADLHNQRRLAEHLGETPGETLQRFQDVVDNRVAPTGDTWAWLGEVIVHATDIRTPLEIPTRPSMDSVIFVAEHYSRKDFAVPSKSVARGLTLLATDAPFRSGSGPEATGPVLDLVMVMAGRAEHLDHLDGPGVAVLRGRLQAH